MQRASKVYNPLLLGLYTDTSPFAFPEGSTSAELNCTVNEQGGRTVRLGLSQEPNGVWVPTTRLFPTTSVSIHTWKNVGESGGVDFIVVQTGSIIHFYLSNTEPLSNNKKPFTIDLNNFKTSYTFEIQSKVNVDSNNGVLVIVSNEIDPLYVVYNKDTDTITATKITLKIRDLEGVEVPYEPDFEPPTLEPAHHYNLKNNGWFRATKSEEDGLKNREPIQHYYDRVKLYPPLSKQWWTTQDPLATDWMAVGKLAQFPSGNTWAPKGHYIYDAFNINREVISGITGVKNLVVQKRPISAASFAGRLWYTEGDKIYFSQVIRRDLFRIGWCYQEADPTAKDINALVDTDGGVISILEAGNIIKLRAFGKSLFVFADNGCWEITGSIGQGFKPTDYSVRFLAPYTTVSDTIIDARIGLVWITREGLYLIKLSQQQDLYTVEPITKNRLNNLYLDIPAKENITGVYDYIDDRIFYLYNKTSVVQGRYKNILLQSIRFNGFYPWEVTDTNIYIAGAITMNSRFGNIASESVLDDSGDVVVTSVGADTENVITDVRLSDQNSTVLKFLLIRDNSGTLEVSFGGFTNLDLKDFETFDYPAYIESGFIIEGVVDHWKQMPYIHFYFKQDEYNSECLFRTKWDWWENEASNHWSQPYSVYSNPGEYKEVAVSKHRVRGKGKTMKIRFDKKDAYNFTLWAVSTTQDSNQGV